MIIRHRALGAWFGLFLAALTACPGSIPAEQGQPVQKIDLVRFQQMLEGEGHFLLVFMAAWCAPCIRELPDLNALHTQYRNDGLKMVGVSVDFGGPAAMQPVVDRLKLDFPVVWLGEAALEAYEISGIPLLIFIKNGAVVEKVVGLHSKSFFAEKIETFLSKP